MATTYSTNARLQKPAASERHWDAPINANTDALDAMTAVGGLVVTTIETPSASLQVRVAPGSYVRADGTVADYAGSAVVAVAAASTACLWLAADGSLATGPAFPVAAHLRLAQVVAGSTTVTQVVDRRVQCAMAGQGLGFVARAGDTVAGPLTVASPGSGTPLATFDAANRLIGFFGITPAGPAPALTPLTAPPSAVASDAIGDVGGSYAQAVLNNNFASLVAKVDALIAALKRHGLMSS